MSTDPRWSRLEALFDAALAWPPAQRAAWLEEACADDPALRDEVQRMLEAHAHPGGILDRSMSPVPARAPLPHPAELARRVEDALAEHYIVERELGRGGMATVFLAHERKHSRRVVLKVLNPDVAARWGGERFTREVQIAARLAHPNIVGLIDSGTADGLFYYVMPYVHGETVRERIDRRGALPVGEACTLLRDVAGALAYAHRAGVVHRDLKPANVLCADEHAFLMDFGVAKLLTPIVGHDQLTGQGIAVGTPAYMAPEQREADAGTVDERADLYAWGLLAYEMLTGALPPREYTASGEHLAATDPARVHARRPEVPRELSDLVAECLTPDPARRLQSADLLVERLARIGSTPTAGVPAAPRAPLPVPRALRRAAVAVVALAVVSLGAFWALPEGDGVAADEPPVPVPVAVAVLTNETGDPSLDSWGRMAGDWITQGLQELDDVSVVAWPTALQAVERVQAGRAEGRSADPVFVLREETGASTVISGAYYLVGDALHFRVDVTDARTNRPIVTPQAISVPRDSAHLGVQVLRGRLMSAVKILHDEKLAEMPGLTRRPPLFEAYQAFDQGIQRYLQQDYRGAAPEFLRAHELDPGFLVPLVHATAAFLTTDQPERAESTLAVLRSRRGELSSYHASLADAYAALLEGDAERLLRALQRAATEAPGSRAWYNYAQVAIEMDRPAEALAALRRLDPDRGELRGWSSYWTQLTHATHLLGEHEDELAAARELRRRHPDRRVGLVLEVRALAAMGRTAVIDSMLEAARSLPPTTYWSQGGAMVIAGEELIAHHGAETRGRAYLERAVAWLEQQLALHPEYEAHREWLGEALYGLERWQEANGHVQQLLHADPAHPRYRGQAAVLAARLGDPDAERLLGEPDPRDRGRHTGFLARIAAVRGEPDRAAALFGDAMAQRLNGAEWLHASAHRDLTLLASSRGALPATLRGGRTMPGARVRVP